MRVKRIHIMAPLTCTCGMRRRLADESPNSHGPECCTCPPNAISHHWGCLASYLGPDGKPWDRSVSPDALSFHLLIAWPDEEVTTTS